MPSAIRTRRRAAVGRRRRAVLCAAKRRHLRGFTVIELLITVAVISILAAIAYPSYRDQILKAHRADGQTVLFQVASREEQFFLDNRTYTDDMTNLGFATDPIISPDRHYSVDASAGDSGALATSFVATATRRGDQADDTRCGDFQLDSTGSRSVINYRGYDDDSPAPEPTNCW